MCSTREIDQNYYRHPPGTLLKAHVSGKLTPSEYYSIRWSVWSGWIAEISPVLIFCSPLIYGSSYCILSVVMLGKWPAWHIHSAWWETNEEPEPSGETSSSLQVQSLWLTAARHDLTHCVMINVVAASPSCSSRTSQCHSCLKDVKKMSWPDVWGKVFIVSSEDVEKTIVAVVCQI